MENAKMISILDLATTVDSNVSNLDIVEKSLFDLLGVTFLPVLIKDGKDNSDVWRCRRYNYDDKALKFELWTKYKTLKSGKVSTACDLYVGRNTVLNTVYPTLEKDSHATTKNCNVKKEYKLQFDSVASAITFFNSLNDVIVDHVLSRSTTAKSEVVENVA